MYNDFNYYQQGYNRQPNYQSNQMQLPQRQQSNLDWIMVQSVNQIDQIIVQPSQKAWIMVQNEPIFALKTADNMGLVSTEVYKFEKYTRESSENVKENYVTRDEMNEAIKSAIKEFKNESNNVTV